MRKWNLASLALALLLTPTALAAQVKIAIIDLDRALTQSARGQAAQQELVAYQATLQDAIEATQNQLLGVESQIQTQQRVLSDERLQELNLDRERLTRQLNRQIEDANLDMDAKRSELYSPVLSEVATVVEEYVQSEGITLVLPPDAVVYAAADTDITDAVIALYNERQTASSPTPAPAAPEAPAAGGGTGQ